MIITRCHIEKGSSLLTIAPIFNGEITLLGRKKEPVAPFLIHDNTHMRDSMEHC